MTSWLRGAAVLVIGAALLWLVLGEATPVRDEAGAEGPVAEDVALDLPPVVKAQDDEGERDDALGVLQELVDDPEQAWLPGIVDDMPVVVAEALPAGGSITPLPETWVRQGSIAAVAVAADHPDGRSAQFVVHLLRTEEGWRVSHTIPVAPQ